MTTTLPPCPLCGSDAKGNASATSVWCDSDYCEMRLSKDNWLAICSRVTPEGCVSVPESEIEALRAMRPPGTSTPVGLSNAIDAIIARLPRKVDHVAVLERMRGGVRCGEVVALMTDPDEIAALEAAIVRMRELKP